MKKNLKPCAYKQSELACLHVGDGVLFVERSGELIVLARLSGHKPRSRRETKS